MKKLALIVSLSLTAIMPHAQDDAAELAGTALEN